VVRFRLRLRMFETRRPVRYIVFYPFALFTAWVAAWMCNLALRAQVGWGPTADTVYWIGLKLALWVAPALLAIRLLERRPLIEFLELRRVASGVNWGLGVGAVIALVNYAGKTLPAGGVLHAPRFDLIFLNAVVVAPVVEEITVRGFLLKRLELNGQAFWLANLLTTLVFIAMHLPGWYFQGRTTTLAGYAARLIPLAVLSLIFGWTKKRSGSLYGAIVAHMINNIDSALFP